VSFWNANGLPEERLHEVTASGHHTVAHALARHDILGIWDTRNNSAVTHVLQSSHKAFVKRDTANTPGTGAVVLVSKHLLHIVQFIGFHAVLPLAWLRCGAVYIGFVYARPKPFLQSDDSKAQFLACLHTDVAQYQTQGQVVLMGDFNATLGAYEDASPMPRVPGAHRPDDMGSMLMDWTTTVSLMTLTGRKDQGEPSRCVGTQSSRIDHAFVHVDLFECVRGWEVCADRMGSDHSPISLSLSVPNVHTSPQQRQPSLRWDFDQQEAYSEHLAQQADAIDAIHAALDAHDLVRADALLHALIHASAGSTNLLKRPGKARPTSLPLSQAALEVRGELVRYRRDPQCMSVDAYRELRGSWRRHVKAARRDLAVLKHERMKEWLIKHPRIFWYIYSSKNAGAADGILPTPAWREFFMQKFGTVPPVGLPSTLCIPTDPTCPLMHPVTALDVLTAFKQLGTAKATGVDGIPAEFVTKAFTESDGHVMVPIVVRMCNMVLQLGHMPEAWKHKAISPVFKSGSKSDPNNYRPIAVATTLYRVFTAIFAARLTAYMHQEGMPGRLLDSQFAFRKQLSTQHAHMVLATCCDTALATHQPLAVVKLDISKAYDTVDRAVLWQTLRDDGVPVAFVQLMEEVYRDTPYVVRVNGQVSASFLTGKGVLQGCALSPSCYNKYLKSCLLAIEQRCQHMGITLTASENKQCVQVNFADDMHGTVALRYVAEFLAIVEQELALKHQTLNRGKCKVLVVQHAPYPDTHIVGLPVVPAHTILGLLYTNTGCVVRQNVVERAQKGTTKAVLHMSRMYKHGCQHDMRVASIMLKADVQATMLFGASIWGSLSLQYRDPIKHALQKPCSMFMRRALQQPHSTANWIVLLLSGLMPVQHWIIRDFVRMWNRLLAVGDTNALVCACVSQQIHLSQSGRRRAWLCRWQVALHKLFPALGIPDLVHARQPLSEQAIMRAQVASYTSLLDGKGDPFSLAHQGKGRRIALVWQCLKPRHVWGQVPGLLRLKLEPHVRFMWLRFLAGNATIPVHDYNVLRGNVPFGQRLCGKCVWSSVGDELHVVLHCPATQHVRDAFVDGLQWKDSLPAFLAANVCDMCPEFVHNVMVGYAAAPIVDEEAMPLLALRLGLVGRVDRS
jgi:Reverse transcriptase (RNA-dependent DNA polymerase)/Endonuclease-reverse transcriptase